ncbi:hypothetical protein L345_12637 [Ophiophagus hannah]|uniref:Uncharacterized protein n=1 Tax=Ophiophagus hannah TaxID=8665 RepID=V8NHR3_OPHHA|nr:hypothetical protein L345_12637 [Ophiophagus hannah]
MKYQITGQGNAPVNINNCLQVKYRKKISMQLTNLKELLTLMKLSEQQGLYLKVRSKCHADVGMFTWECNKYPDVVALPEGLHGDYMLLRSTQLPEFELMIVWKIQVDEKGNIIPVLDLLNKIPLQGTLADKFASDAPQGNSSLSSHQAYIDDECFHMASGLNPGQKLKRTSQQLASLHI